MGAIKIKLNVKTYEKSKTSAFQKLKFLTFFFSPSKLNILNFNLKFNAL